ncbi:hypothetical protein OG21DRAFT_1527529 [Imleria badia]|nr:hypothetical protein OG21DRAFT_1527529 [Imleria badia]
MGHTPRIAPPHYIKARSAGLESPVLSSWRVPTLHCYLILLHLPLAIACACMSAIIKKEESPLVVPLLFEETGDAKKEDQPIDWEQILVIPHHSPSARSPTSNDGSSTVVKSISGILHQAFLLSEVLDVIREGVQLDLLQREQERRREEIRQRVIKAPSRETSAPPSLSLH